MGRDREKTRSKRTHVGSDQDYVACIIGGTLTKTLTEPEKESLQDYYTSTIRSLATQVSLGHKLDPEIDQAMDFTYKLDRKSFQSMITYMDWLEVSAIRKFQVALKANNAIVYVTTYHLGHSRTTTGTVTDNHQTNFASDSKSAPSNKKEKGIRKTIPHAEWIKMTVEQQDDIKAQNSSNSAAR